MQLICGQSNPILAERIAREVNAKILKAKVDNFSDGELRVEVMDQVGKKVVIVQSTSNPANNHLMELLLLADTVKRAGAKEIIAIIPYFGYSRQDRMLYKFGPISASLIIKLIEASGITQVITLDLHSAQIEGMFNIPVVNLDASSLFLPEMLIEENTILVSPDIGGVPRVKNFCNQLNTETAIINKIRMPDSHECYMANIMGEVNDKKIILIDDIVDSGQTLCKAASLLKQNGACQITAFVSHAVLSGNAINDIENSEIKHVYVSDSIYHPQLSPKFKVLPMHKLFAKIFPEIH